MKENVRCGDDRRAGEPGKSGEIEARPTSAIEELYERVQRLEAALLDTTAGHICLLPLGRCAFCRLRSALEKRP